MQLHVRAVGEARVDGGRQRGGLVDHQEIAGAQLLGQLGEPDVAQRLAAAGDHQAHRVAGEPARLCRLGGFERGRQRERERRAHARASASARAA